MAGQAPPGTSCCEMDGGDTDMCDVEGCQMDRDFAEGNCVEVDFGSDEDVPVESDDELLDDDGAGGADGDAELVHRSDDSDAEPRPDDSRATCTAHTESVLSVAVNAADWRCIATGGQDDTAILWSVQASGSGVRCVERCRLKQHTDSVVQVAFSHDGRYLASASYDNTVKIWNPENGALVFTLEGPTKEIEWILWHPKGHAILAGSNDTMAWMWWAPTGKLMQIFAGHAQSVSCGCWGEGGKLICTGSEDRSVIVWNPRGGTPQQHVRQLHEGAVIALCSSPVAPVMVTGSDDAVARAVHMETGKVLATLSGHTDSVESVLFSNSTPTGGVLLATASMDGKINIWDGKTFEFRLTLKEHEEKGGVVRIKWLPAPHFGAWLVTASTDYTTRLFNALSGECLRTFQGHEDAVLDVDVALVPSGPENKPQLFVFSSSDDKTCRVFVVDLWTAGFPGATGVSAPSAEFAPAPRVTVAAAPDASPQLPV